ncbi:MAG: hypothetical protein A2942_03230 [Candidatus Lloydbacteria bacterium RIFCSPLOWO2_01_FULL_50_20]|uniref:peptide chain release factor N(5)-glutamine methyltransferase n=1 Tax=Candidatus Lloydbacteria bacterium RIFCSPLOWO2_01_FULL_50_20 TaxID=1798665 RepID=A0A1G2DDJ1_9BACT|nr:MAG: hypothetical protein A3C13_01570 [Candidatus Lloydbacteria bacterium RIFCSPHIGHO2_02_FULL_50_11]OGZ11603.1 MAG: hypothetical protein A2942_03230 [Candidatus Lloydbacteria bacterium RIFCSPLOWO2_01_FULL_50_20]
MNKETRWLLREKYHGVETPEFQEDVERLNGGLPLAYVIGWVDFLGCRIDLSAKPLIPRPETEFWVEQAIAEVASCQLLVARKKNPIKILDLFSGSGCIGIALLKHLPNATVDFGEKDPKLCQQIKKNIALNNIDASQTCIVQTDTFSNITETYDYIFANPPYIDSARKETAENSVILHEPHGALFADEGGLSFIIKLINESAPYLKPRGVMYIEFGENQKEAITLIANAAGWKSEFHKDQFSKWRMAKCVS